MPWSWSAEDLSKFYVTRGWPTGWCPRHVLETSQCAGWCVPIRRDAGTAARALDAYWHSADRLLYLRSRGLSVDLERAA